MDDALDAFTVVFVVGGSAEDLGEPRWNTPETPSSIKSNRSGPGHGEQPQQQKSVSSTLEPMHHGALISPSSSPGLAIPICRGKKHS